ncbi:MAG: hypothetical protein ACRETB_06830 [Steroidobacteraceae bacterium]
MKRSKTTRPDGDAGRRPARPEGRPVLLVPLVLVGLLGACSAPHAKPVRCDRHLVRINPIAAVAHPRRARGTAR